MIDAELLRVLMRIARDLGTIAEDVRARQLAEQRKKEAEREYWQEREEAAEKREQAEKAETDWHAFIRSLMHPLT